MSVYGGLNKNTFFFTKKGPFGAYKQVWPPFILWDFVGKLLMGHLPEPWDLIKNFEIYLSSQIV